MGRSVRACRFYGAASVRISAVCLVAMMTHWAPVSVGAATVRVEVPVNLATFPPIPGLAIALGEMVTIEAANLNGSVGVCFDAACTVKASPNGSGLGVGAPTTARKPGVPLHGLVCGVGGQSRGELFFVGSHFTGRAPRSGELFCGMNEDGSYEDNGGRWAVIVTTGLPPPPPRETLTRASTSSEGNQSNGFSLGAALSGDGGFAVFSSFATNLVPDDVNFAADVFVRDLVTRVTTRVSVADDGTEGNGDSFAPRLSADGRVVAFYSSATNLVAGDTNGWDDVFVHDRVTKTTTRVSLGLAGAPGNGPSFNPALSGDGWIVAFQSLATNLVVGGTAPGIDHVYIHDRTTGVTSLVSVSGSAAPADCSSQNPALSVNGRFVAFHSCARNLVSGGTPAGIDQVYLHDHAIGETRLVSVDDDGAPGKSPSRSPSVSDDGGAVAFASLAQNLTEECSSAAEMGLTSIRQVYVYDAGTRRTTCVRACATIMCAIQRPWTGESV